MINSLDDYKKKIKEIIKENKYGVDQRNQAASGDFEKDKTQWWKITDL